MSFDIVDYILNWLPTVITLAFIALALYSPLKKVIRRVTKIGAWINHHVKGTKEDGINFYEEDTVWWGELYLKGANVMSHKLGGKHIIKDAEKEFGDYYLEIDGKKLYSKKFIHDLLTKSEDVMKEQAKIKLIAYGLTQKIDKCDKNLRDLKEERKRLNEKWNQKLN